MNYKEENPKLPCRKGRDFIIKMTTKQKLQKPIPLTLEQYECQTCKKKFYINKEDQTEDKLRCPYCEDIDVINVREFDIEILAINDLTQL